MVTTPLVKCKPLSDYMGSGDQMTNRNFYHTDDYGRLQQLGKSITRALKDEILLTPRVKLVPRGTLPVSEGKAVRVVDKRKVYQ